MCRCRCRNSAIGIEDVMSGALRRRPNALLKSTENSKSEAFDTAQLPEQVSLATRPCQQIHSLGLDKAIHS